MIQRIGLDMDGVLYRWDHAVRAMIREEFGISVPQSETWDFISEYAGKKVWKWLWSHEGNVPRMFTDGGPYPGAIEGANRLYDMADDLAILTSGPAGCESAKVAWLDQHEVPYDRFVRFDRGEAKTRVRCNLYVDDNPAVIRDVVAADFPAMAILVDRPWNRGDEAPERDPRWVRARGWKEVIARAEDML